MNDHFNRRRFLASVGFGAAAITAVGQAANAQTELKMDLKQRLSIDPKLLELQLVDPRAVEELRLTARLPKDTPITKMGLTRQAQEILTPGARELTKADLQAMAEGEIPRSAQRLTVADIESVKVAFGKGYQTPGDLAAISCCCCTPCCCAAAIEAEAA